MTIAIQTQSETAEQPDFSKVHLVHVVRQYVPSVGGLEDVVRNLTALQKGRFASLKVVTLNRLFKEPDIELPAREVIDGVDVHRIPFRGSTRYPLAPRVLAELGGANLVHVHAVDFFFDALALARPWHGRRLVATTHGGFFHTRKHAALKTVWFNTLTRFSASRYGALACCSESDFRQFRKIAPERACLIENGVDIAKFRAAASEKPVRRLLTLGRFSANKRPDRSIELLAALRAQDPDWMLDIAGMESDLTREDLLARARALGVADNLRIHVGLSDGEIRALMGQCSFFVSASEYEGFGLALIEAMSAGLVPVVHPNGAFRALAEKHASIELADFSRPEQPAAAIAARLAASSRWPDLRNTLIADAEAYSWKSVISRYDALYRKVLPASADT
ncbi:glycosyltransferase family 4 protein [Roseibium sp.]|uniref:glycosyltransferase family 4 protein n=1 Tax=Roseibium sp. TaxID=1936156 RepID=UPI0032674640